VQGATDPTACLCKSDSHEGHAGGDCRARDNVVGTAQRSHLPGVHCSVTRDLSIRIAQAGFGALPPEVVEVARTTIFDDLGATIASSVEPPTCIVLASSPVAHRIVTFRVL
jgi:hypothetical protein